MRDGLRPNGPNVVSFDQVGFPKGHPALDHIESYWQTLRAGRLVPCRSEVDPRGLAAALKYAFVLEHSGASGPGFRIAGTHVLDRFGSDIRGKQFPDLFASGDQQVATEAMIAVFNEPSIVRMRLAGPGGAAGSPCIGELVCLPLRDEAGGITRAIGGVACAQAGPIAPSSLTIAKQERQGLTGYARLPSLKAATPPARSHLRLVVSNDS